MKKNNDFSEIKFMLILSLICSILICGTNTAFRNKKSLSKNTINAIYKILREKENDVNIEKFNSDFKQLYKSKINIWVKTNNDSIIACESKGNGMWGEITLVFVLDLINQKIVGLNITEQKETSGLGSKISEEVFTNQFNNKKIEKLMHIDAITGATESSKSVEKLLTKSLKIIKEKIN